MTATSLLRVALVALLGSGVAAAQRQPRPASPQTKPAVASPYLITGTVLNSVDESRVPHCRVSASPVVRGVFASRRFPAALDPVECDEHGHFSVSLPSAGSWRLSASARGFISQDYEQHQMFSSAIMLTAAKPAMDLQFHISPEATITGVVVDEAGEPVRTAHVSLLKVPEASPGSGPETSGMRSIAQTQTDDRGMYELANVAPGGYRIVVQAQPWYAAFQARGQGSSSTASLDPSLDFAYPLVWFPGVDDPALAETIKLVAGDTREADFRLTAVPSIHIHILPPPGAVNPANGRAMPIFPMVQQIVPGGGGQNFAQVNMQTDAQGQVDVGGLAPGTYRLRFAGPNQSGSSVVEVAAGSPRTLDLASPSGDARVTLHFEGFPESGSESRPVGVGLIGTDGSMANLPFDPTGDFGPGNFGRQGRRDRGADAGADHAVEVPPGRYEVVLQGRPDAYLTGITAKGAEVEGRYVTLSAGASTLTLHVASGRATLTGVATLQDKPSVGAMALLVPTTIEDPNALRVLRRDQTNTDGSFDIADVIPGQYILVVLDHGWEINWNDPATLRGYLSRGVPLDLVSGANVKQNVDAQAP